MTPPDFSWAPAVFYAVAAILIAWVAIEWAVFLFRLLLRLITGRGK